jgi:hypothetical protein
MVVGEYTETIIGTNLAKKEQQLSLLNSLCISNLLLVR